MKFFYFAIKQKCLIFLMLLSLFSCSDDDTDPLFKSVEDPEGTITVLVRNTNNGATQVEIPNCKGYLYIDSDNKIKTYNPENYPSVWKMSSIGSVKGLGNISKIPQTNWNRQLPTSSNTGCVIVNIDYKNNQVTYTRLFVEDYILTTNQEVIGATFKFHSPLNDGDAKNINLIKLEGEEYSQENYEYYKIEPAISWSIKSDADWCNVSVVSEDIFSIHISDNMLEKGDPIANVVISSDGLKDVSLTVQREEKIPVVATVYSNNVVYMDNKTVETLVFRSTADWSASTNVDWCTVSPEKGRAGEYASFIIHTISNITQEEREGIITISATNAQGATKLDVRVIQNGTYFAGGKGTKEDPFLISTPNHLSNIHKYSYFNDTHFKLINDIDMTEYLLSTGEGWKGIPSFGGVLDGNGFSIKNIWFTPVSYYNSYGFICKNSGTIKNLGLEIVAGKNLSEGYNSFGALVGKNELYGRIEKCFVKGEIEGFAELMGGLVGENQGKISSSYIEGAIIFNGQSYNHKIGGLVGVNRGTISNSYSIAAVNTGKFLAVGGLVAVNYGEIEYCYFAGTFQAESEDFIRPITEVNYSANIKDTYYDKSILRMEIEDDMSKTTEQMKQQSTFQNWNFDTVWRITEGTSYPTLK